MSRQFYYADIHSSTVKDERIKLIDKSGSGFLYYACRSGTTGVRRYLPEGFAEKMKKIKQQTHLPIVAGFGISTRRILRKL